MVYIAILIIGYLLVVVSFAFWWKVAWPKRWYRAWLELNDSSAPEPRSGAAAISANDIMMIRREAPASVRDRVDAESGLPSVYALFRVVVVLGALVAIVVSALYIMQAT